MICAICYSEVRYTMKFLYISKPMCWDCIDKFLEGEQQLLKRAKKTDIIEATHDYREFVTSFLTETGWRFESL
jgi:hypothetical protein